MLIHDHLRRAIIAHAKAAKPGLSDAEAEAIVARVASSDRFAASADFLDDSLIALVHADLPLIVKAFTLSHASAPSTPAPSARDGIPPEVWARMTPTEKLGRHYQAEAGERSDVEAQALAERAALPNASAIDKLAQHRATVASPTKAERKAADNPKIRTDDLSAIVDPAKRLEAFRNRSRDAKSTERLRAERAVYEAKSLDRNIDAKTRAAAALELAAIDERLKALGNV